MSKIISLLVPNSPIRRVQILKPHTVVKSVWFQVEAQRFGKGIGLWKLWLHIAPPLAKDSVIIDLTGEVTLADLEKWKTPIDVPTNEFRLLANITTYINAHCRVLVDFLASTGEQFDTANFSVDLHQKKFEGQIPLSELSKYIKV